MLIAYGGDRVGIEARRGRRSSSSSVGRVDSAGYPSAHGPVETSLRDAAAVRDGRNNQAEKRWAKKNSFETYPTFQFLQLQPNLKLCPPLCNLILNIRNEHRRRIPSHDQHTLPTQPDPIHNHSLGPNPPALIPLFLAQRGEHIKLIRHAGHEDGVGGTGIHGVHAVVTGYPMGRRMALCGRMQRAECVVTNGCAPVKAHFGSLRQYFGATNSRYQQETLVRRVNYGILARRGFNEPFNAWQPE